MVRLGAGGWVDNFPLKCEQSLAGSRDFGCQAQWDTRGCGAEGGGMPEASQQDHLHRTSRKEEITLRQSISQECVNKG